MKFNILAVVASTTVLALVGAGCASKKPKANDMNTPDAAIQSSDLGSSDLGNEYGLVSVRFDYDSSLLSPSAKAILRKDAQILKDHVNVSIQVEGNCDARGGIQYNLALGQRRADSVQHFLVDQGISESRLTTISYGKEKPLDNGDTEEAYAKNRRANLAITKK